MNALRLVQWRSFAVGKRELKALVSQYPDNQELFALYCSCLSWSGEREKAQELLEERIAQKPSASALSALSVVQYMGADKDAAMNTVEEAAQINSDDYLYLRSAADLESVNGDMAKAKGLLRTGERLYPQDPWIYSQMIGLERMGGSTENSRKLLEAAPQWFKETPSYHNGWGQINLQEKNLEATEASYREALAMSPEDAAYWGYLSMALRHQGKMPQAVEAANRAIELNPCNRFALETMAKDAKQRGDKAAAKDWDERVKKSMPVLEDSKSREALKKTQAGDIPGAIALYQQVLADPKLLGFRRLTTQKILLDLYANNGRWQDARQLIETVPPEARRQVEDYEAEIEYNEGNPDALAKLDALALDARPSGQVYTALIRAYLRDGLDHAIPFVVDRVVANLPLEPTPLVYGMLELHNAGKKDQAERLYQAIRSKRPSMAALKFYEMTVALERGDFRRAKQVHDSMNPGERITPVDIAKQFLRRLFGG